MMRTMVLFTLSFAPLAFAQALPRFEVVATFDAPVASTPTVFWSADRLCVPARVEDEGFVCYAITEPTTNPKSEKHAKKQKLESGLAVPLTWQGLALQFDTKSGTLLANAGHGQARFSTVTEAACPKSGARAVKFLVVKGRKPEQLAILRLDRFRSSSLCAGGHDVACPQDSLIETWSVLRLTPQCESAPVDDIADAGTEP